MKQYWLIVAKMFFYMLIYSLISWRFRLDELDLLPLALIALACGLVMGLIDLSITFAIRRFKRPRQANNVI